MCEMPRKKGTACLYTKLVFCLVYRFNVNLNWFCPKVNQFSFLLN